ncbi:unnamed protein product [Clonostachys rosea]|uniref:Digeranylgeranylglyceryl phosphate synthase n=1 Tax=Bionectria ochroleuca TaxID=29856 RepID=A0ABY6U4T1_BIOOC|nr:unnamed protein product [Clonostachys rosea]
MYASKGGDCHEKNGKIPSGHALLPSWYRRALSVLRRAIDLSRLFWAFTESDFNTFVIPNSAFGVFGALSGPTLQEGTQSPLATVLLRLPLVVFFNWYNVLNFDLANQRSIESIEEDRINKPWRPIVTGKVTPDQTRRAMLFTIPASLLLNYVLGVWKQGVFILILTWMQNDLRGGDEVIRDVIISAAYGMFNSASLDIAIGTSSGTSINRSGILWTGIISGVILTTMQVQDLKDQMGDRTRGRKTVPLVLGDRVSRYSIAVFVAFWSVLCPLFWQVGLVGYVITATSGGIVDARVLSKLDSREEDAKTWRWWCFWTMVLYLLPIMYLAGI